jgi:hypothetical protein
MKVNLFFNFRKFLEDLRTFYPFIQDVNCHVENNDTCLLKTVCKYVEILQNLMQFCV